MRNVNTSVNKQVCSMTKTVLITQYVLKLAFLNLKQWRVGTRSTRSWVRFPGKARIAKNVNVYLEMLWIKASAKCKI